MKQRRPLAALFGEFSGREGEIKDKGQSKAELFWKKKKFNRASVTAPRLAARVLARKRKERESFGASRAEIEPADGGRDIDRAEGAEREKTYPWRFMRYKGGERLCALCLEPCRAWQLVQSKANRVSQQIGGQLEPGRDDGRIMGGFWREGKPQQQSATELERERAGCSAVTRTVPVSRNWEWEGGRTEAHGYCSSLVVRRGKERADREGTRRRMSVQRLREDGGGQDAEL